MFGAVFGEVSGLLNKRFALNALFPVTLAGIALLVIWEATGEGLGHGVERFAKLDGTTVGIIAILAVAALLVAATLLASQSVNLLQWMEGMRGPLAWSWLATPGKDFWNSQRQPADTSTPSFSVPRADYEVAPTALGTLGFANAEYLHRNYAIDAAVVWPRLAVLLSPPLATQLDDAETSTEQLVAFSTVAFLVGFTGGGLAAFHRAAVSVCLLLPAAGLVLGYILYRAVLPASTRWSELMRAAFDLHRFELLDALHIPRPRTSAEEREIWGRQVAVLLGQEPDRPIGFGPEPKSSQT